jgi:hypothetical protein
VQIVVELDQLLAHVSVPGQVFVEADDDLRRPLELLAHELMEEIRVGVPVYAKEYSWVNERQIWSIGTADLVTGKVRVAAFMQ